MASCSSNSTGLAVRQDSDYSSGVGTVYSSGGSHSSSGVVGSVYSSGEALNTVKQDIPNTYTPSTSILHQLSELATMAHHVTSLDELIRRNETEEEKLRAVDLSCHACSALEARQPKLLSCFRSVCRDCVPRLVIDGALQAAHLLVDVTASMLTPTIQCPNARCGCDTTLTDLLPNLLAEEVLSKCAVHCTETATWLCVQCFNKRMCHRCCIEHVASGVHADRPRGIVALPDDQTTVTVCFVHGSASAYSVCLVCSVYVCEMCYLEGERGVHYEHRASVEPLATVRSRLAGHIRDAANGVKDDLDRIDRGLLVNPWMSSSDLRDELVRLCELFHPLVQWRWVNRLIKSIHINPHPSTAMRLIVQMTNHKNRIVRKMGGFVQPLPVGLSILPYLGGSGAVGCSHGSVGDRPRSSRQSVASTGSNRDSVGSIDRSSTQGSSQSNSRDPSPYSLLTAAASRDDQRDLMGWSNVTSTVASSENHRDAAGWSSVTSTSQSQTLLSLSLTASSAPSLPSYDSTANGSPSFITAVSATPAISHSSSSHILDQASLSASLNGGATSCPQIGGSLFGGLVSKQSATTTAAGSNSSLGYAQSISQFSLEMLAERIANVSLAHTSGSATNLGLPLYSSGTTSENLLLTSYALAHGSSSASLAGEADGVSRAILGTNASGRGRGIGAYIAERLLQQSHDVVQPWSASSSSSSHGSWSPAIPELTMHVQRQPLDFPTSFGESGSQLGQLNEPNGLALEENENILVADTNNNRIQGFYHTGQCFSTFNQTGSLQYPFGMAVHGRALVVIERSPGYSVKLFDRAGSFVRSLSSGRMKNLRCVTIDYRGRVIVIQSMDEKKVTIYHENLSGNIHSRFNCDQVDFPRSVAANKHDQLFIVDNTKHCICVYSYAGIMLRQIGREGITDFPVGIFINDAGHVVVVDNHMAFKITVLSQDGHFLYGYQCDKSLQKVLDVAVNSRGFVAIACDDRKSYKIYVLRFADPTQW